MADHLITREIAYVVVTCGNGGCQRTWEQPNTPLDNPGWNVCPHCNWAAPTNVEAAGISRRNITGHQDSERIGRALAGLFDVYKPEGVGIWLRGAKESFGGVSPVQALVDGRAADFEAAVERLRSGAMG